MTLWNIFNNAIFILPLGFSISAARLGLPDTGFLSYGEMVDQGQQITQAVSIPVIGDGDNGYGNAMNVKRTIKGYIRAGFAGILLEDQVIIESLLLHLLIFLCYLLFYNHINPTSKMPSLSWFFV